MGFQFNPITGNLDLVGSSDRSVFVAHQDGQSNGFDGAGNQLPGYFGVGGQTLVDLGSTGTGTVLRFPTIDIDSHNGFSANKCEYVIPKTGVYLVASSVGILQLTSNCSMYFASILNADIITASSAGVDLDAFYTFGGNADYYFQILQDFHSGAGDNIIQGFYIREFFAGDRIAVALYQTSGADGKTFMFFNNARYTSFMIHQLS